MADHDFPAGRVSMKEACRYWFKLGLISFGGPAGQISIMHQELVEKRRWISERRFLHAVNYCMLLPGPEATQLAIYIAWLMHGVRGGIVAGVLFFLPAFLLLSLLAGLYLAYGDMPLIKAVFDGIKPVVVAIVFFAAWRIGVRVLRNALLWGMAACAFIAIFFFKIGFPWIVLAAAILGAIGGKVLPEKFKAGGRHDAARHRSGAALIDDDTPVPAHARFTGRKFGLTLGAFIALWLAVMYGISGQSELFEMGYFFTKAAFLTIGGAYAVLPYVYQGGVEQYAWLTAAQMMDGLALGEATPGPLIMIVTWIGYLGGTARAVFDNTIWAGIAGAGVATFFTFLPSFLFILAGGPLVEATRDEPHFTAPLTGVTAAIVGVILNLAVFFAWHTFWPHGTAATAILDNLQLYPLLLAVAAFIALWKYRLDIMTVILAGAILGVVEFWMI
ncbi:MAG: chromate efflux transporter [Burkholderiales bacterium]|nr:chromate efflux transporter [Burkholderiales bacterium]